MKVIIEGLTGAGKTHIVSTIKQIYENSGSELKIFYEEETFGELIEDLVKNQLNDFQRCYRLRDILNDIDKKEKNILLERFHLSHYVFMPDWELFREIDKLLTENNFKMILLFYDESLFEERALRRVDMQGTSWTEDTVFYWGSVKKAMEAYKLSQQRRIDCLNLTALPYLKINTTLMDWEKYSLEILNFVNV
jgi:thymidylate kinase